MSSWEQSVREARSQEDRKNTSFSSSLLDKIYHSIEETGEKRREMYSEMKKDTNGGFKGREMYSDMKGDINGGFKGRNRAIEKEEEEISRYRRACLVEKWMDRKVTEKVNSRQQKQPLPQYEQDALFFSSSSCSSDSSCGGFSSSETDSVLGSKAVTSCFVPRRPKPIRTSAPAKTEKSGTAEKALFCEQRELHYGTKHEEGFIKSKSRAIKIYSNLKKVQQPLSPGGRLTTFLNSIFTTGNSKKSIKSSSSVDGVHIERNAKSAQASTCSSASSFARSCLSKNSPSTREKLRNGVKRSVRFHPVSVIVDEDCKPCGHKSLHKEEEVAWSEVSQPTCWRSRDSATLLKDGKEEVEKDQLIKLQLMQITKRVEEAKREYQNGYNHQKQNNCERDEAEDEDDDDAASYSSSDLFELDHHAFVGKDGRYFEELPVYETTCVDRNRPIVNGSIF